MVSRSSGHESLEARLRRIESRLDSVEGPPATSTIPPKTAESGSLEWDAPDSSDSSCQISKAISPGSSDGSSLAAIPPLHEVLSVVDAYFRGFNQFLPLFHHATFMTMLHDFYSGPRGRSKLRWGLINCVLALGSRMLAIENSSGKGYPRWRIQ